MNKDMYLRITKEDNYLKITEGDNILMYVPYDVFLLTPYSSYKDLVSGVVGYSLTKFIGENDG